MTSVTRRRFLRVVAERFPGDLAIVNARMITMDRGQPEAQAALVSAGRIALVGTTEEVKSKAGGTGTFDAGGQVVVPGFIDAHTHFELTCIGSSFQAACHTPPYSSLQEIKKVLAAKASDTPKGQWVIGRGSFSMREKLEER